MSNKCMQILMSIFAVILSALSISKAVGQIVETSTTCAKTAVQLVYKCDVQLSQDGKPVSGARFLAGADMPTMPLAHNIRPVEAVENADTVGQYEFDIELEMFGEWRLIYDIFEPFRDRLQENLFFLKQEE